jgi:hypothetical protein
MELLISCSLYHSVNVTPEIVSRDRGVLEVTKILQYEVVMGRNEIFFQLQRSAWQAFSIAKSWS